jgi:hypothetical protein
MAPAPAITGVVGMTYSKPSIAGLDIANETASCTNSQFCEWAHGRWIGIDEEIGVCLVNPFDYFCAAGGPVAAAHDAIISNRGLAKVVSMTGLDAVTTTAITDGCTFGDRVVDFAIMLA